ncbi:mucin-5AC [Lingula anatina]|uniref:Mucin-5AC n=1 Tax=Lingula anatina TaxID=7574 RepID=A0A1S3KHW4_LINAN|nr:mucin-5AC [Lingula anatina]|eukprot:XP_013422220.1 mucin-5AC [Lingula anatina]
MGLGAASRFVLVCVSISIAAVVAASSASTGCSFDSGECRYNVLLSHEQGKCSNSSDSVVQETRDLISSLTAHLQNIYTSIGNKDASSAGSGCCSDVLGTLSVLQLKVDELDKQQREVFRNKLDAQELMITELRNQQANTDKLVKTLSSQLAILQAQWQLAKATTVTPTTTTSTPSTTTTITPSTTTTTTPSTTTTMSTTTTSTAPPTTAGCPGGFVRKGASCYYFTQADKAKSSLSWQDSRATCQRMGADLVSIDSSDEYQFLKSQCMRVSRVAGWWTGGNDLDTEGRWEWIANKKQLGYTMWYPVVPVS